MTKAGGDDIGGYVNGELFVTSNNLLLLIEQDKMETL